MERNRMSREGRDRGDRERDRDDDRPRRDRDDSRDESRRGGRGKERGGHGSSGFKYQRRDAASINKRASMGGKEFDSYVIDEVKLWKPNDGANTIRILPPTWPEPEHYGRDIWVHFGVGPDNQAYLCLHKMEGEHCPICEERDRARRAGEDEEYVKSLEPTRRVLMYLIDRDHEGEGVQAWAAPWTIDRDITKISVDRRTQETIPLDDPEEGYDVEFDKTGKGQTTKYVGIAIARRPSPLGKQAWLDYAVDKPLPDILMYHDAEHIEKVFGGGGAHRTRRDDDAGSRRGREERDGDDRDNRRDSRDRDDDRGSARRGSRDEPKHTWESIHEMTGDELDALIEQENLDVNPNKADSDEELADWICEELKIEKPRQSTREDSNRRREHEDKDDSPSSRLREMREKRGR